MCANGVRSGDSPATSFIIMHCPGSVGMSIAEYGIRNSEHAHTCCRRCANICTFQRTHSTAQGRIIVFVSSMEDILYGPPRSTVLILHCVQTHTDRISYEYVCVCAYCLRVTSCYQLIMLKTINTNNDEHLFGNVLSKCFRIDKYFFMFFTYDLLV